MDEHLDLIDPESKGLQAEIESAERALSIAAMIQGSGYYGGEIIHRGV